MKPYVGSTSYRFPIVRVRSIIFKRAVADELGIQSAITGMVDFLEEDTIVAFSNLCASFGDINI